MNDSTTPSPADDLRYLAQASTNLPLKVCLMGFADEVESLIAERDALRNHLAAEGLHRAEFNADRESLRQQAERSASEVARLASRCEGLESAVASFLSGVVEPEEPRRPLYTFRPESVAALRAALSPPASDATEPLAAGVA